MRGPAVVDRAQSQCAPEGAEDGLQVGPRHAGAPQPPGVPADAVGAQAVDPGMGRPVALQRPAASRPPPSRCGPCRRPARRSRSAGLQPSGALPDPLHAPGRALARQALVQRRRVSPFPSVSAQARRALPAGGADGHRSALVEDAPPLAQPGDVPLRGETPVEHDDRLGRRVQGRRHGLQRAALGDVAGQDPGAARWRRRVSIVSRWRSRRSLAQPVPRGARGGRRGHAADEAAEDGGALRTGQAPAPRAGTADGAAAWPTGRRARRRPSAGGPAPGSRRRPAAGRPMGPRGRRRPAPAGRRCAGPRPRPQGSRPRARGTAGERGCARCGRTAPARPRAAGRRGGRGCAGCAGAPCAADGADEALGEVGLLALGAGASGGRRTNRLRWEQALGRESRTCKLLRHYIGGFRRLAMENQRLAAQNTPNSAKIAPRLANLRYGQTRSIRLASKSVQPMSGRVPLRVPSNTTLDGSVRLYSRSLGRRLRFQPRHFAW